MNDISKNMISTLVPPKFPPPSPPHIYKNLRDLCDSTRANSPV